MLYIDRPIKREYYAPRFRLLLFRLISYPLKAVTRSGIVRVCNGSIRPITGRRARFEIPVFVSRGK